MIKVKFKETDKDGNIIESKIQFIPEPLYKHLLLQNKFEIIVLDD